VAVSHVGDAAMAAEAIPGSQPPAADARAPLAKLLILSAAGQQELDQAAQELRGFLESAPATDLGDLAYTLRSARPMLAYRRFAVATDCAGAIAALSAGNSKKLLQGRADGARRTVAFLFPGVGDQYVGMAHGLYENWTVFRDEVDRCAAILQTHLGLDIREVIYPASRSWQKTGANRGIDLKKMLGRSADESDDPETARLNRTRFAQPALFTIEYATARLWQSFGVHPDVLIGHSMGEYVAACLAGVLSLPDALRLITARASLVDDLPAGAMLSVMLPEAELAALLPPDLFISLINGPANCVVAGAPERVAEFEKQLEAREVICRRIQNGHAFHSRMLDPIVGRFEEVVAGVPLGEPTLPYTSNVTGGWLSPQSATDPAYWCRHLNHTARFSDALHRLWQLENPILLECGPGRTLGMLASQHTDRKPDAAHRCIWSIRQRYENTADDQTLLSAAGKLWLSGVPIGWDSAEPRGERSRTALAMGPARSPGAEAGEVMRAAEPARETSPLERDLLDIWRKLLGVEDIGPDDEFFAAGGTSLLCVQLFAEIARRFGVQLRLATIIDAPTVRSLAALINAPRKEDGDVVVCLRRGGSRNFFLVHDGIGETLLYLNLARRLPSAVSVYAIEPTQRPGIPLAHRSFEEMAAAYTDRMRRIQPQGPYLIGGMCAGGVIAHAMAACLRRAGEQAEVVLFDAATPQGVKRAGRIAQQRLARLNQALSIAAVARKARNLALYELRKLWDGVSERFRFWVLKRVIDRDSRWPTVLPSMSAARIYVILRSHYSAPALPGVPVLLLRATAGDGIDTPYKEIYRDPELGWAEIADRLVIVDVPGGHSSMLQDANVDVVTGALLQQLPSLQQP
jgi:phthiocerol/phenolphthiocerol synthesis type-I polyketide synthase E